MFGIMHCLGSCDVWHHMFLLSWLPSKIIHPNGSVELTDEISKYMDSKEYTVGVFLDLAKAFDTVDHNILLTKLNHCGVRGVANNWFKSYLENRNQYVSINGISLDFSKVTRGVPQGSILDPLLLLFI